MAETILICHEDNFDSPVQDKQIKIATNKEAIYKMKGIKED
ncbi:hypothetical protein XCR1_900055 [Xenorhabdus cabanillasii JM26]|uniref:Uncharacterized protein n=1 Tax=Xenorhabdus cabanillasii JM26 TaxID=1427517 RepID=W1JCJ3_9GAMM|nr:hypothetical protein XCR1_900055 [Xenorhabdus cabanillasii JM26]